MIPRPAISDTEPSHIVLESDGIAVTLADRRHLLRALEPLARAANAFVAASGHCAERRILHVSSGAARSAYAGWGIYCATKAGLDLHAQATRLDGRPGLRIASLAPGVIDTAMQAQVRASDPADFPQQARFAALKADGQLSDAVRGGAQAGRAPARPCLRPRAHRRSAHACGGLKPQPQSPVTIG